MACIYRNCLEALRPYHGILLLYEERELLDKLPLDASPTLKKMLSHASPTNSFRTIASDSDLALLHVSMSAKYISTTISKIWKHDTPFFANFPVALLVAGCHYWPKTNKNNEKWRKVEGHIFDLWIWWLVKTLVEQSNDCSSPISNDIFFSFLSFLPSLLIHFSPCLLQVFHLSGHLLYIYWGLTVLWRFFFNCAHFCTSGARRSTVCVQFAKEKLVRKDIGNNLFLVIFKSHTFLIAGFPFGRPSALLGTRHCHLSDLRDQHLRCLT